MEWLTTPLVDAGLGHAAVMDDGMSERDTQLRRLPEAVLTLLRLAEAKLAAAHDDARSASGAGASDE
jgi:hypothetical protein